MSYKEDVEWQRWSTQYHEPHGNNPTERVLARMEAIDHMRIIEERYETA